MRIGLKAAAAAAVLALAAAAPSGVMAQTGPGAQPVSAEWFAREPAIASVDVSDDGKHLVAVTSIDGDRRTVSIWKTDALDQPPYVVGTDERSEIVSAQFIKNDRLFVSTQQLVDHNPFSGAQERTFATRTQVLDLEGNPVRIGLEFEGLDRTQQAFVGVGGLVSALPRDPQSILVRDPRRGDVYKLNLYTGSAGRVERGSQRFSGGQADLDGEVRARTEFDFDGGAVFIGQWLKSPSGEWAEHFRWYARDRVPVSVAGFTNDPNVVLVERIVEGEDRSAIYEYSINERRFSDEPAFAHPLFNASGVVRSTAEADFGEIIGFTYQGARGSTYYVDPNFENAFNTLREVLDIETTRVTWTDIASGERAAFSIGDQADIAIIGASDDRGVLIVRKSGGSTPPEFHLLMDGRVRLLGRAYPELSDASDQLGEVTLFQFEARDGLMIPAVMTKPNPDIWGPGPYPALVTPHGGPWSREDTDWDATGWTQYFAARGYAVIQPDFRGSMGWGQRLWRAGDGEWGRKMQDDMDDAARWMIANNVADPARIAMHGYSYGGYAAMMAAVRPNGLYKCSAAGAGPATIDLFKKGTFQNRYLREFQHPTAEGEDPLRRVNEVSIPIFLYTGDRDTVVLPSESRTFASALEAAGKPVKLQILPNMEHGISTWTPTNFAAILTSVEGFLKTDCGM